MNNTIQPITREDFYMHYLAFGGDVDLLPEPFTKKEEYLYNICLRIGDMNSGGGSNINVIDNLLSTSTADALSANQGKILNEKIPVKSIVKLSEDTMNDGIGVKWSDNSYERIFIKNTPTVGKSLNEVEIVSGAGYLLRRKNNGTHAQSSMPFFKGCTYLDGKLTFKTGGFADVVVDINAIINQQINIINNNTKTISSDSDFIKYFKEKDGIKIEITEEEFNLLEDVSYFKTVDGKEIEITEEEFNSF